MKKKLVIVDYGMGNLQSVKNTISILGQDSEITNDPKTLEDADAYILPGVGAFAEAMKNLKSLELISVLAENVRVKKKPFLGICLGMQLIAESSEEQGKHEGLGWIPAQVVAMHAEVGLKVPHVGWNNLNILKADKIFKNIDQGAHFYFDHSYHMVCDNKYIAATCDYPGAIVAAIQHENIYAAQFHPEKSQTVGLKLLRNFLNMVGQC